MILSDGPQKGFKMNKGDGNLSLQSLVYMPLFNSKQSISRTVYGDVVGAGCVGRMPVRLGNALQRRSRTQCV